MKRNASATWYGTLKQGRGELDSDSGVLSATPYSFGTRFENETGTNPEELIGAAHAGCYSMALAGILAEQGVTPERIDTKATVSLDKVDGGYAITKIHLDTRVEAPDLDADTFEEAANAAKDGCPVSQALDVEVTLSATLVTD